MNVAHGNNSINHHYCLDYMGNSKMKWHPFVVLLIAAFGLALALGEGAFDAVSLINKGFGGTMSRIGLIILLGAMLGELLERAGLQR